MEGSQTRKHISSSPDENLYLQGSGNYFTGNITPLLHNGRSEEEIEREGLRIYRLALQCDRFHKYRMGGKSDNERKKKDIKVWPEHLEIAFFKGIASTGLRWCWAKLTSARSSPSHGQEEVDAQ